MTAAVSIPVQAEPRSGLRVERTDAVVRVVLDRPPLNILDIPLLDALAVTLSELDADASVKAVVLTGSGRAFCAGVDVADHAPARLERMLESFRSVITRMLALRPPLVAAVGGAALGGGCELLLASDVVLAREDARIGQPEIRLGVFPPAAVALLPRLVGRQRALDLLLTGRVLAASDAARIGLVTRAIPVDSYDEEVGAYVRLLASLSGPVLRLTKRTLSETLALPLEDALATADTVYVTELMRLRDAQEGIAAFMEKRAPVWKEG